MKKFLSLVLLSLAIPAAASAASINLTTTVGGVNRSLGIASSATPVLASMQGDPTCPFGGCTNPAPCPTSPENPTALLAVLGAAGLLLGRIGYGRMRSRGVLSLPTAA